MNENSFDIASPAMRSRAGTFSTSAGAKEGQVKTAKMVPQEQYDALKARFIESETQF